MENNNIRKELKKAIFESNCNYGSFSLDRVTVSNMVNCNKGSINSLCTLCDELGLELTIKK